MRGNGHRNGYSLELFTQDMMELVASQPDQQRLFEAGSGYLERLLRVPHPLPEEFTRPSGKARRPNGASYALHRSPGLFISAVIWGPGDHIGPHDHATWGMIGVLDNAIQETRFRRLDDGSREGYALIEKDRAYLMKPGEVSLLVPDEDEIHALNNFSDRPTIEIHVYGKDLVGLDRRAYNAELHSVKLFASPKFDNC